LGMSLPYLFDVATCILQIGLLLIVQSKFFIQDRDDVAHEQLLYYVAAARACA